MIRKKKKYVRPKQIYEAERIKEENVLKRRYGLKNKKEIWKALAKANYFRQRAKTMARLPLKEQEVLFKKLRFLGLNIKNTADVLNLKVEDILDRRLPTIIVKKKHASTVKQARQMVTHRRILINGKIVSSPSYLVSIADEKSITVKNKEKKPKVEKIDEIKERKEDKTEDEEKPKQETKGERKE